MAKITELDPPPSPVDGSELVPLVQGGAMWTSPIGPLVDVLASPYVSSAEAAAAAAQAGVDRFRETIAQGVADFAVGDFFASAETGNTRIYRRTDTAPFYVDVGDGAAPITLSGGDGRYAKTAELNSGDEGLGAALVKRKGGGTVQHALVPPSAIDDVVTVGGSSANIIVRGEEVWAADLPNADPYGGGDSTAALAKGIERYRVLRLEKGSNYRIGELPVGYRDFLSIVGESGRGYVLPRAGEGPRLTGLTGADSVLDMAGAYGFVLRGFMIDGQTIGGMHGVLGECAHGTIDTVSVHNCPANGFGGSAAYIRTTKFLNVNTGGCDIGIKNLIDSFVYGGKHSTNRIGVDLQTGANDNTFIGVKNEWNSEENWNFFTSINNSILGGVCDRAGRAGMKFVRSEVIVSAVVLRRNGRYVLGADNSCHIWIEGAQSIVEVCGIQTRVGFNDDGTGDTTPDYAIVCAADAPGSLIVSGSNLRGCLNPDKAIRYIGRPATQRVIGNAGAKDQYTSVISTLATGATSAGKVFSTGLSLGTYAIPDLIMMKVCGRRSTGTDYTAIIPLLIQREAGDATATILEAIAESGVNHVGAAATDAVQIAVSSIAADGSSVTLTWKNNAASDVSVNISLMPG